MKAILGAIVAIVVVGVLYGGYYFWQLQQAASKYKDAKEVASESIEKDGSKWTIKFESVIAKPIDKVWQAMQQPERSAEFIKEFKKSELKKSEGNTKEVEIQVQVLTLPLQTFLAQFTFDDANKQMTMKTLSGPQDVNGNYVLSSLGEERTLLVYNATAIDRVTVPLPLSVQKGAVKELFIRTIQAIQKGIESEEKKGKAAA